MTAATALAETARPKDLAGRTGRNRVPRLQRRPVAHALREEGHLPTRVGADSLSRLLQMPIVFRTTRVVARLDTQQWSRRWWAISLLHAVWGAHRGFPSLLYVP